MSNSDPTEQAVEAGAKAFHDAARKMAAQDNTRTLRWETNSEQYRQEMRDLVRPAVLAAVAIERERCAVIAETAADCLENSTFDGVAAAIRAQDGSNVA
ncbi:hypothetical protein [Bosea sp. NPDC055594]